MKNELFNIESGTINKIVKDGILFSIIVPSSVEFRGLEFFTPKNIFLQVGQWLYNKNHKTVPHMHIKRDRIVNKTQEAIYVVKGSLKVTLFDFHLSRFCFFILKTGDLAILLEGGHSYEILEDNTKVLEFKNGPFTEPELDRVIISDEEGG
jgi:hypothetical protein